jgi:hypothetical protein
MVQQDFRLTDDYVARKGTLIMPSITAAAMQVLVLQHMYLCLPCIRGLVVLLLTCPMHAPAEKLLSRLCCIGGVLTLTSRLTSTGVYRCA